MYYIGLDIGGTNIKIGVVSDSWEIVKLIKIPTENNPFEKIVQQISLLSSNYEIAGIGAAVAGVINKEGVIIKSPNIPTFDNFPLKQKLEERFAFNIKVENDADSATIAEAFLGEGKNSNKFVLLTLGTGIGGGLWFNGKIADFPMEVGHMSINYNGKNCACGNIGCLEVYASGRAIRDSLIKNIEEGQESLIKNMFEGNFYRATPEDIYNTAMEGDSLCRNVLKEAGKALGAGMANLINLFHPEKIILTGGLSNAVNIYIETSINEAKKRALKGLVEDVEIVRSKLVDSGGILGAVLSLRGK
jgi:glucokinase